MLHRVLAGGDANCLLVGYVGRLAAEKRVELLEPLTRMAGMRLVIVGDGPRQAALARSMPGARFLGRRGHDDLARIVASLGVLVHPGAAETFCQVIQEALSCGVPVVAAARGGPLDLVRHGENGWLWAGRRPEGARSLWSPRSVRTDGSWPPCGHAPERPWPAEAGSVRPTSFWSTTQTCSARVGRHPVHGPAVCGYSAPSQPVSIGADEGGCSWNVSGRARLDGRMTSLVNRTIAGLRDEHEMLAPLVTVLTEDHLTGPSAASAWSLAQVLAHLGSGAEVMLAGLRAGLAGADVPGQDYNTTVWDRWSVMAPGEQRDAFLEHNEALVTALEALTPEQRAEAQFKLGFAPAPLPVVAYAGMRLNEATLHGWDVRVALDPAAGLAADSAQVIGELYTASLGFMLGFMGKADRISGPVRLDIVGSGFGLMIRDTISFVASVAQPTATFSGPLEAAVRMIAGRLAPEYTPAGLTVSGNVTIDQLRHAFPGY